MMISPAGSAAQTGTHVIEIQAEASARYVICYGWTHIFSEADREVERETRWVYDRKSKALAILDIKRSHKWREAGRNEKADVLDSLVNGNAGCLDNPNDWDFELSTTIPDWD